MVVAVDCDGTLWTNAFPEIGIINNDIQEVIDFVKNLKMIDATIVLWTCREDTPERKYLTEAIEHCKINDIPIDYVNEYQTPGFSFCSRKVCTDMYIDDKALNVKQIRARRYAEVTKK